MYTFIIRIYTDSNNWIVPLIMTFLGFCWIYLAVKLVEMFLTVFLIELLIAVILGIALAGILSHLDASDDVRHITFIIASIVVFFFLMILNGKTIITDTKTSERVFLYFIMGLPCTVISIANEGAARLVNYILDK